MEKADIEGKEPLKINISKFLNRLQNNYKPIYSKPGARIMECPLQQHTLNRFQENSIVISDFLERKNLFCQTSEWDTPISSTHFS